MSTELQPQPEWREWFSKCIFLWKPSYNKFEFHNLPNKKRYVQIKQNHAWHADLPSGKKNENKDMMTDDFNYDALFQNCQR